MSEVKLKDIADALHISIVTVSNALSKKSGVSEELRAKIFEKADEMGYDYSKYKGKKEKAKSLKIGVIIPEKYIQVGVSFYWSMYQKVAYIASKKQCFTMMEIVNRDMEKNGILPKILMDVELDGFIIIGWMEHSYIKKITKTALNPVVLMDFQYRDIPCDAVMSNNYIGMYKATKYLTDRGHSEIAFVGSTKANENIMDRYYGYRKALEEVNLPVKKEWKVEDRSLDGKEIKVRLPEQMPTAFVCNSDFTASYLYDELVKNGYKVPEDISITAYDNYLFGHPFSQKLTTYNVDMEQMAKVAVEVLVNKMLGDKKRIGTRYIDSHMIERNSVRILNEKN